MAHALPSDHYRRYFKEWEHLARPFGSGGFGQKAEAFARFFGTPKFLVGQTLVVGAWIVLNSVGMITFDLYPFILLNLAFSLQAAYAAPLILLAQTRQADRDMVLAMAEAQHREALAQGTLQDTLKGQQLTEEGIALVRKLLDENTRLTQQVQVLTREIHRKVIAG